MDTSHGKELTGLAPEARYFREPSTPQQRQYEALRAYFHDGLPSQEAAARFGYSPGSFRVLCHDFRQDPTRLERLFRAAQRGPQHAPRRDRVREQVIALRKRNLSVYDIQRELREAGADLSINSLSVLLREEGFARLPRRRDDERPTTTRPEEAAVADVRQLDLSPRQFRTRFGGLFLFAPLMAPLDWAALAQQAELPGTRMIPALQALRSCLALKLIGTARKSHVMQLVDDEGLALFAGLNVLPKRAYLASYTSSMGRDANLRLMECWSQAVPQLGLPRGDSLDLDFHTVAANTAQEPLEAHFVSRHSRRQQGVLMFLARDAQERVLCYGNAGIAKAEQANEILRFVDFWQRHTGAAPRELVFDSGLTTYANLGRLTNQGIRFLTLRRRSRQMLAAIYAQPPGAWHRITLPALSRTYRTPRVLEQTVQPKGYGPGSLRQLSIIDLGHEDPTVLITNDLHATPVQLITRYAQRMLIENGIAEAIHFFHLDALSSMVGLKVDFDLQLTLIGSTLYRLLARRLPDPYQRATAKTLFTHLLDVGAHVSIDPHYITVLLDKHTHNPYLKDTGLTDKPVPMPWLGHHQLVIQLA